MQPTNALVSVEEVTRKFPMDHSEVIALDNARLRRAEDPTPRGCANGTDSAGISAVCGAAGIRNS